MLKFNGTPTKPILILWFLWFFLWYVNFSGSNLTKDDTLVSLHILFRHGERSPSHTYRNDPYKNYSWPGGWDQLTNKGKLEMYKLGLSLRGNYDAFLTKYYLPDDVYVQSSYADRCQMSAQLLLAGLYPPVGQQIWNTKCLWQPIPIHSIPRNLDNKIAIKRSCPSYERALAVAFSTDEKEHESERKELYDYLTYHTGDSIRELRKLESLYNTLEIEKFSNLTLPDWTFDVFPDKMKDLAALSLATFTRTDFMKRLHGGVLLKEIVGDLIRKRDGKLKPNRKVFLYSGHDLTVVTLMRLLGFEELLKPEFGATVILEQRYVDNVDVVKVLYKSNPDADLEAKPINGCSDPCSLDTFHSVVEKYMVEDWEYECRKT